MSDNIWLSWLGELGGLRGMVSTGPAYQELDSKGGEIRILRLLPSPSFKSKIQCVLHTAYLKDKPEYEALSYVWGDLSVCESIVVDGRPTKVTVNLAAALRRLRYAVDERDIWVDRLCIHQADEVEKSYQVNMMKEIFSNTTNALLWLGDYGNSGILSALDVVDKNARVNAGNLISQKEATEAFGLLESMAQHNHYDHLDWKTKRIAALRRLMSLSWWTRVWTVQEAVLPKTSTLVCGTMQLPFERVTSAYYNTIKHFEHGCCTTRITFLWKLVDPIRYFQGLSPNPDSFFLALSMFRQRQASDPRDRVFALLGFGGTLAADYSLSQRDLCMLSVRSPVSDSGDLLSLLRITERHRSPDLPTWAPDWCTDPGDDYPHIEAGWLVCYKDYNAAGNTKAQLSKDMSGPVLDLQGTMVDEILEFGRTSVNNFIKLITLINEWNTLMNRHCDDGKRMYPRGGTYEDAFWRVVIADIIYLAGTDRRRARPEDEANSRKTWSSNRYSGQLPPTSTGLRFFVTRKGLIGAGARGLQVGDQIHVLLGGKTPFILRADKPKDDGGVFYQYIGNAYVHGIMDGEIMDENPEITQVSLI
ncbi:heterokaryon incompatibility protein-domain-containing protein [Hypomontagnella monticulosa]|nr:heterokaryon incompatibility protein-domain-containing protein [Hypomontagnella monticulosa]